MTSAIDDKSTSGPKRERSYSSATESDDFSLWSDTGDIAEQLADEEDPLRIELDPLNKEGRNLKGQGRGGGKGKKVAFKYQDHPSHTHTGSEQGIYKEAIHIPNPPPRRIGTSEKILALIMAPTDPQTAKSRGLVGQPLLYVTACRSVRLLTNTQPVTSPVFSSL